MHRIGNLHSQTIFLQNSLKNPVIQKSSKIYMHTRFSDVSGPFVRQGTERKSGDVGGSSSILKEDCNILVRKRCFSWPNSVGVTTGNVQ